MSLLIRLLFIVGLVSAFAHFRSPRHASYSNDDARLVELRKLGKDRLDQGEEGSLHYFDKAKETLQILESFAHAISTKVSKDDVRKSGLLHLTEDEFQEVKAIAIRMYTRAKERFFSIVTAGERRQEAGQEPNYKFLDQARQLLEYCFKVFSGYDKATVKESDIFESGLLQLTEMELYEAEVILIKLQEAKSSKVTTTDFQ